MRTTNSTFFPAIITLIVIVISTSASFAQDIAGSDSIPDNGPLTKQATHIVQKGSSVHQLPQGAPFAAFSKGGTKEKDLENFMRDQKVAGLLILHDGALRLERYALGHSKTNRWSSLSVAKSVTSTLVGAAIKDGYIKTVDDYVTD